MTIFSRQAAKEAGLDTYPSKKRCAVCKLMSERWVVSKQCTNCFRLDRSRAGRKRMRDAFTAAFLMTLREGVVFVPLTRNNGRTWKSVGAWETSEYLNKESSD